jgi:hypothetical protein
VQKSSPEKFLFDEKDNRHAGAGLKMGLLYPAGVPGGSSQKVILSFIQPRLPQQLPSG